MRSPKYKSSLVGSFFGFFALRILHHLNNFLSCASGVSNPLIKRINTLYNAQIDRPPLEAIKKRIHEQGLLALPPMTAVERISHEGEISKEGFRAVQDVANQAKEALIQATEDKAAYEKQYIKFRKFLSASSKDIPLSEIVDCIDKVCKFVKQIGQGIQEEKTIGAAASVSCWSGDYEQRAVCESQPERRKSGQNKSVSDLPGGCVPPYHYVWECKGESIYAGHPAQRRFSQKGSEYPVCCWKRGTIFTSTWILSPGRVICW